MFPLLGMYFYINDEDGDLNIYKKVFKQFSELWGSDLHLFGENIFSYKYLEDLLAYLNNLCFNTISNKLLDLCKFESTKCKCLSHKF